MLALKAKKIHGKNATLLNWTIIGVLYKKEGEIYCFFILYFNRKKKVHQIPFHQWRLCLIFLFIPAATVVIIIARRPVYPGNCGTFAVCKFGIVKAWRHANTAVG